MWAPDQWKVNKGKIVIRRSQSSTIAPCQRIQDSLGFWIPFHGFWIPVFSSGTWILDFIPQLVGYLSSILDSKALDSGFNKQNFPGFRVLQTKSFQIRDFGYPYMVRSTSQTFSDLFTHIQLSSRKFTFLLTFDFIICWIGVTSGQCSFFRLDHILSQKRFGSEKVFFRLDITVLTRMFGVVAN